MQAIRFLEEDEKKTCAKTGKPAQIQYYNFYYTTSAFLSIVQQKVKKQLLGKLDRQQNITVDSTLALYYCKRLYPEFTFTQGNSADIISWSMDDELDLYWKQLRQQKAESPGKILLFLHVQDRELELVSKLLDISHEIKEKTYPFDDLDNQFYGIKTTLLKNMTQIKTLGRSV